jgi:cell shape-determining protein MreC
MKKTFLAKRNAILSTTGVSLGAAIFAILALLVCVRFLAPNTFLHGVAPLYRAAQYLTEGGQGLLHGLKDGTALAARNEQLIFENQALAYENRILLEQIKDISGLSIVPSQKGIFAGVLMRPPESPYDTLVLSAGSADGAKIGMSVFGRGGVPIGTVSAVTEDFSRVTLFSAPDMRVHGWVGERRIPIELYGAGGGAVRATLPRAVEVVAGESVFAPGPGAIPFGTIVKIDDDPSSPEIELRIMTAANIFSLTWVHLREGGSTL